VCSSQCLRITDIIRQIDGVVSDIQLRFGVAEVLSLLMRGLRKFGYSNIDK